MLLDLAAARHRDLIEAADGQRIVATARALRKAERRAKRAARRHVAATDNPAPAITCDEDAPSPAIAS
jgi:hypothetical protein